jgi:glycosyltransferase involved in cell wall biosynthesis
MRISVYTAVRDGIFNDLHVVDMLKHHLALADELVVNEGFSTDATYEAIRHIDPKIVVVRTKWEAPRDGQWWVHFKDAARRCCTGDWCIHLDADEFIPEWEFDDIRGHLKSTQGAMCATRFINFYGNYQVFHCAPEKVSWPARKMNIHRNIPEIEFWGDGSNVKLRGQDFAWQHGSRDFTVHHFGYVKHAARLRQKWYVDARARQNKRSWLTAVPRVFNMFPHKWMDQSFLPDLRLYEGFLIKAVRDNPGEFIRDRLKLVDYLNERLGAST